MLNILLFPTQYEVDIEDHPALILQNDSFQGIKEKTWIQYIIKS